jgi:hypothetical protein
MCLGSTENNFPPLQQQHCWLSPTAHGLATSERDKEAATLRLFGRNRLAHVELSQGEGKKNCVIQRVTAHPTPFSPNNMLLFFCFVFLTSAFFVTFESLGRRAPLGVIFWVGGLVGLDLFLFELPFCYLSANTSVHSLGGHK